MKCKLNVGMHNVSEKEEKNKNQTVKQFYVIVVLYYSEYRPESRDLF